MTRDGLVEKNLNDQTTVRVSSRTGDLKLERKEKSGRKESLRAVHLARDEPVAGQKIRSRHRTETPEKPQRKEKMAQGCGQTKNLLVRESLRKKKNASLLRAGEIPEKQRLVELQDPNRKSDFNLQKRRRKKARSSILTARRF